MKDNIKIYVARMYEFVNDISNICEKENNDYDKILADKTNKLALTMCLLQIGELAKQVEKIDISEYEKYRFDEPKGLRNRIAHGYGKIDFDIIKETLKNDIPNLKKLIESNIEKKYLENPYLLYDKQN